MPKITLFLLFFLLLPQSQIFADTQSLAQLFERFAHGIERTPAGQALAERFHVPLHRGWPERLAEAMYGANPTLGQTVETRMKIIEQAFERQQGSNGLLDKDTIQMRLISNNLKIRWLSGLWNPANTQLQSCALELAALSEVTQVASYESTSHNGQSWYQQSTQHDEGSRIIFHFRNSDARIIVSRKLAEVQEPSGRVHYFAPPLIGAPQRLGYHQELELLHFDEKLEILVLGYQNEIDDPIEGTVRNFSIIAIGYNRFQFIHGLNQNALKNWHLDDEGTLSIQDKPKT